MVQAERRKTSFYAEAKPMFAVDFSKSTAKVRSFFETTKLLHHFFCFFFEFSLFFSPSLLHFDGNATVVYGRRQGVDTTGSHHLQLLAGEAHLQNLGNNGIGTLL